jgi:hypothetical protein
MWPRILLALLCLFAVTTSAECAWVLWVEEPVGSNRWSLASRTAFERKRECDEAQRILKEAIVAASNRRLPAPTAQPYTCLPDSIDPRGPKGK